MEATDDDYIIGVSEVVGRKYTDNSQETPREKYRIVDIIFRNATSRDLPEVQAINEAVLPAVNSLTGEQMAWFLDNAPWFRVAASGDHVVGILVGFYAGSSYPSENYRWFAERYPRFAYVDRVAVDTDARRQGIASRLYADFIEHIPADVPVLTCEVNTRPANPGSLRFHERMGFLQVGAQETDRGQKSVALLAKDLVAVR